LKFIGDILQSSDIGGFLIGVAGIYYLIVKNLGVVAVGAAQVQISILL
jgi:hypothetical protein